MPTPITPFCPLLPTSVVLLERAGLSAMHSFIPGVATMQIDHGSCVRRSELLNSRCSEPSALVALRRGQARGSEAAWSLSDQHLSSGQDLEMLVVSDVLIALVPS